MNVTNLDVIFKYYEQSNNIIICESGLPRCTPKKASEGKGSKGLD